MSLRFASADGKRCFDALSEAAEGFDNLAVFEAGAIILGQVICSGSYDLETAQARARAMVEAMVTDMALNWHRVLEHRKGALS